MSITPAPDWHESPPLIQPTQLPPPPRTEKQIIRRWLWRQFKELCRAGFLIGFGLLLGVILMADSAGKQVDAAQRQETACRTELNHVRASLAASNPPLEAAGALFGIPPQVMDALAPELKKLATPVAPPTPVAPAAQ